MSDIEPIDTWAVPPLRLALACGWLLLGLCAARKARPRGGSSRPAWCAVAAAAGVLAFESVYPLRFVLTPALRDAVRAAGGASAIAARRPVQAAVVLVLLAATAYAARRLHRSPAVGRSEKVALSGAGLGLVGVALEVVSLHHLDQSPFVYPAFRAAGLAATAAGVAGVRSAAR